MGFLSWLTGGSSDPENVAVEPGTLDAMDELEVYLDADPHRRWTEEEVNRAYDISRPLLKQGIILKHESDGIRHWVMGEEHKSRSVEELYEELEAAPEPPRRKFLGLF